VHARFSYPVEDGPDIQVDRDALATVDDHADESQPTA
jgi:hypothetical protein